MHRPDCANGKRGDVTTANPGATNGIHQGRPYALSGDLGSPPHAARHVIESAHQNPHTE